MPKEQIFGGRMQPEALKGSGYAAAQPLSWWAKRCPKSGILIGPERFETKFIGISWEFNEIEVWGEFFMGFNSMDLLWSIEYIYIYIVLLGSLGLDWDLLRGASNPGIMGI